MEINKPFAINGAIYDHINKKSSENYKNKQNTLKSLVDVVSFSQTSGGAGALNKATNYKKQTGFVQDDFSEKLKTAKEEIVSDLKKQQAIDYKEQVKEQVKSHTYIVDASAVATKLKILDFDFTV